MKKIIIFIFIFSFVSHCGFTPLYSNYSEVNFSINLIKTEGDKELNNFLKSNLAKFENNESSNQFTIELNTNYMKNILSKNKAAKTTNFKLTADAKFKIFLNGEKIKELTISETNVMDKNDDNFKETKNEKIIKKSFASSIANKLITEISILNDN